MSAVDGTNVDVLERLFLQHLPEGEPLYPPDYVTDQTERFFVAEIVREQVLQLTHDELPFSTAVVVDRFEEPGDDGDLHLYCTILVERESQKPIVIGKGGAMIKQIGTAARAGARALPREARLPGPARESEVRVARRRADARRASSVQNRRLRGRAMAKNRARLVRIRCSVQASSRRSDHRSQCGPLRCVRDCPRTLGRDRAEQVWSATATLERAFDPASRTSTPMTR